MSSIPMDDILPIWNETPPHSWSALRQTLEQHKGKTEGVEDTVVDLMLVLGREEEQADHPYPISPQELYRVLNQRLGREIH